jgi:hypothetical protein
MFELGRAYEAGKGVEQDRAKALEWYRRAGEAGSGRAHNALTRLERSPGAGGEATSVGSGQAPGPEVRSGGSGAPTLSPQTQALLDAVPHPTTREQLGHKLRTARRDRRVLLAELKRTNEEVYGRLRTALESFRAAQPGEGFQRARTVLQVIGSVVGHVVSVVPGVGLVVQGVSKAADAYLLCKGKQAVTNLVQAVQELLDDMNQA